MSRKYPEILLKNEDGIVLPITAPASMPSFASPLYRELSYKMIEKLAQHYGMIPVLSDGNSTMNLLYSSTIIRKEQAFRDYLRAKYNHNIQLLNDAWGTAFWSEAYSSFLMKSLFLCPDVYESSSDSGLSSFCRCADQ